MSSSGAWRWASLAILILMTIMGLGRLLAAKVGDLPPESGPDVVILDELVDEYEAVPFEHLSHARMAQMWDGCETCHHRPPRPGHTDDVTTGTVTATPKNQGKAEEIPACKSCHSISVQSADIHMPSLKGAYHRQCLNCHREWMHKNACVICHEPNEENQGTPVPGAKVSPDDIVGRMHPPIPEPEAVTYQTRFTPAAGGNVLFRHKEHTTSYGINCVNCHYRDNCSECHSAGEQKSGPKPLQPGMTWDESHGPCIRCHNQDRCHHCHYEDGEEPPAPFDHLMTGQGLDKEHADIDCRQCHSEWWGLQIAISCGNGNCHEDKTITYPDELPGPITAPVPEAPATDVDTEDAQGPTSGGPEQ